MNTKRKLSRTKGERLVCIVSFLLALLYAAGVTVTAVRSAEPEKSQTGYSFDYENRLFDTSKVHTIDIRIKESDWQTLKDTSLEKNYFSCNVVIDGETFSQVGVRTKGNSTLVQSISQGWDRQSLVLNFGKFNKSQRYYGLDKLSLYNNACDSSYMKNMICLDMMRSQGIATPLCSYTAVYLNGEYVGLYTAMEGMDESFTYRNFGGKHGNLYKPEQYDAAALLTGEKTNIRINLRALTENSESVEMSDFLQTSDSTVALQYQGDDLSLYDEIWNNAIFKIGNSDKKRLVKSLQSISEGNAAEYADIEELARYFAVNAFVLNTDNYLTNMAHNYYLYEKDGKLSMLPWDYDQTMGTIGAVGSSGEITEFINTPIDEPLTNTTLDERPMLKAMLSDAHGKAVYYETLQKLLDEWIYSGYLDSYISEHKEMIRPWVESDPNMKERMDIFEEAVHSVRTFGTLRAESISGQLAGTIPSTHAGQAVDPETRVDATGFSSPDSGSLFDMLLKNNPDIKLDDVVERVLAQVNLVSIVKTMPVGQVHEIGELFTESDNEGIACLVDAGLIRDKVHFKEILVSSVIMAIRPIGLILFSVIILTVMLIIVKNYGNCRKPRARRKT